MALRGISGSLVSTALLAQIPNAVVSPALRRALLDAARRLGPASSARHVFDTLLLPIVHELGSGGAVVTDSTAGVATVVHAASRPIVVAAASAWNGDLHRLRHATAHTTPGAARWWIGTNGITLRILDIARAYTRRALDFDVTLLAASERSLDALQLVLRPGDDGSLSGLEALVGDTERYRTAVGRSLQSGVELALSSLVEGFIGRRRRPIARDRARADALTVVYRILFLLFAEARGLVPQWHPVYRDSYTIESLRPAVEGGGSTPGLWQSLQAIARLAHRGCTAGTLRVVPFNGRLFSPATAPLAESLAIDDGVIRDVLLAVTTERAGDRRTRISYADLGVEQLGAVYERVLEGPRPGVRKSTGTFYTPRSITEYLVRRTLAPLVRGRSADAVLGLRVVDPAMGSGAFLVAACRYLAAAYEEALIAEGAVTRGDISSVDRAAFRRTVAVRCLYGVDLNPTAVQLARLSLWLCTLAADRPLTFLDHHLRAGNSLAGARAVDIQRQPPGSSRRGRPSPLPLLDDADLTDRVRTVVEQRIDVAVQPDDSAAVVRRKERVIDALEGGTGPLASWRAMADAWCAAWFWPDELPRVGAREWPALRDALAGRETGLPSAIPEAWRRAAVAVAARERFFHWELEFPEVFFDSHGVPRADGGFDAVIGNPPWTAARALTAFSRESGCYRLQGDGHANLYQLFAERMLQLAAPSGRVGALMPGGLLADHGCARLREELFTRSNIDAAVGFDNHEAIFPIHRGMKFVLLTATRGGSTTELPMRTGLRSPGDLDDVPDAGPLPAQVAVPITLIERFSGSSLAVPELRSGRDLAIAAGIVARIPALSDDAGWNVTFGRELNATDDSGHFGRDGIPVLEGKLLAPFVVHMDRASRFIDPHVARELLGARVTRPRLAYREVAAATNRLTLIAAILPADTVSTHTIFCLRQPMALDDQWCLCGILNSFVANYLVRLRGGTHVPSAVMQRLPAPRPMPGSRTFVRIGTWSKQVAGDPDNAELLARLHAEIARAYGIGRVDLAHILATFPLVPEPLRSAVAAAFSDEKDRL